MSDLDLTSPAPHGWEGRRENVFETRRRGYGRAVRVGMIISLGLHAFLLLFVAPHVRIDVQEFHPLVPFVRPLEGPRVVRFLQRETEPPITTTELPPVEEERLLVERALEPTVPVSVRNDEDVRGLTNPEKLNPRMGDKSVRNVSSGEPFRAYEDDPYVPAKKAVLAGLSQMLDSLEVTVEQGRRAVGWFAGEGDDGLGFALEGIVCGEQVITLNLGTVCADEGSLRRESLEEARTLTEIQQSNILLDSKTVQRERADGIRRRTMEQITRRDSSGEGDY